MKKRPEAGSRYLRMPFPILLRFPTMFSSIPPLVITIPTPLPFGIQIASTVLGLMAALAMVMDRIIQSGFRFFDGVPALVSVIRARLRRCNKHQHCDRHRCRYC